MQPLLRYLRAAKAHVDVALTPVIDVSSYDVVLVDLRVRDAWEWLHRNLIAPIIALVDRESTGMRALLQGAAGVLNLQTAHVQEIVGSVNRVARREHRGTRDARITALRERVDQSLYSIARNLAHCGH